MKAMLHLAISQAILPRLRERPGGSFFRPLPWNLPVSFSDNTGAYLTNGVFDGRSLPDVT